MGDSSCRDYRRRLDAYAGAGGITCPCCRPADRKIRRKLRRAAKRAERATWRRDVD